MLIPEKFPLSIGRNPRKKEKNNHVQNKRFLEMANGMESSGNPWHILQCCVDTWKKILF